MMKFFFCSFFLFVGVISYSQNQTPTGVSVVNQKAEFPGGQEAFRSEFMRMVYAYIDMTAYAVNGKFSFILTIDEKGKMSEMKIYPKVRNDEEFKQDMTFAMKRIKKKWKPAVENGIPVSSNIIFEINFSSEHADHD